MPYKDKAKQKKYMKEYFSRPEVKEKQKERMKEYYARPEVKEKRKELRNKAKMKK